ncbi:hypothetical protein N657DRAFT_580806, partial [Parathielavia appendiculata]
PRESDNMLPDKVQQEIPPDQEIQDLERQRTELKGSQFRIHSGNDEKRFEILADKIRNKENSARRT